MPFLNSLNRRHMHEFSADGYPDLGGYGLMIHSHPMCFPVDGFSRPVLTGPVQRPWSWMAEPGQLWGNSWQGIFGPEAQPLQPHQIEAEAEIFFYKKVIFLIILNIDASLDALINLEDNNFKVFFNLLYILNRYFGLI